MFGISLNKTAKDKDLRMHEIKTEYVVLDDQKNQLENRRNRSTTSGYNKGWQ